jgi:hypothetical protein
MARLRANSTADQAILEFCVVFICERRPDASYGLWSSFFSFRRFFTQLYIVW